MTRNYIKTVISKYWFIWIFSCVLVGYDLEASGKTVANAKSFKISP